MDIEQILMLASAERVDEVIPAPAGVAYLTYRVPDYPYAGNGRVGLHAICDQGEVLFVDCGPANMTDKSWFSQVIDELADSVDQVGLFMTHCHCDHVGEAAWFARQGVKGCISGKSAIFGSMDADACNRAFGSVKSNLPLGVGEYCTMQKELWESLDFAAKVEDWDLLTCGDRRFEVMPLPGHASGHCGLLSKDKTLLFSGDALCQNPPVFSLGIDQHDAAAAMECFSSLLCYPLQWVVTSHEGFLEGEGQIRHFIKEQIAGIDAKARRVLDILHEMRGYKSAYGYLLELKGEDGLIAAAQRGRFLNVLSLAHYLAFLEFLYDYEKVNRNLDDDGCAVYEPARYVRYFA